MFKFDAELNRKILKLAPKGYSVRDVAPDTFQALKAASAAGLVIYSGASDNTVYGDPAVNWAFRAWHDSLHLQLGADFSAEGEKRVGMEQARIIGSDVHARIIIAEVSDQVAYYATHNAFPDNQVEFVLSRVFKK